MNFTWSRLHPVRTMGLLAIGPAMAALMGCAYIDGDVAARPSVYLLMGQSNMAGRGDLAEATGPAFATSPNIMLYGNDEVWRVAREPIDSDKDQIDAVSADKDAGVGPGLTFANALLGLNGARSIILVPCAKGGSSIQQWAPSVARDTLYGSCLARARAAAGRGRLAGAVWYQGETDAHSAEDAAAWAGRFTEVIGRFRADLGAPRLPLVVIGLGDSPVSGHYGGKFPAWTTVQDAQTALRLPAQTYVSAAGLPRNPDQLHLSTPSQAILGAGIAKAMVEASRVRR